MAPMNIGPELEYLREELEQNNLVSNLREVSCGSFEFPSTVYRAYKFIYGSDTARPIEYYLSQEYNSRSKKFIKKIKIEFGRFTEKGQVASDKKFMVTTLIFTEKTNRLVEAILEQVRLHFEDITKQRIV